MEVIMNTKFCPKCKKLLRKKNYKNAGVLLILNGLFISPLLLIIAYGTIVPYANFIISIIFGIIFIFRKDNIFYYCNVCKNKYTKNTLK
jgi:hypothetical protein